MLTPVGQVSSYRFADLMAATLVGLSGPLLFVLHMPLLGYGALLVALGISYFTNTSLFRDLTLLCASLLIMSMVPINTDISVSHMLIMGAAMLTIVGLPYVISRYIYKQHLIRFPWHFNEPWSGYKWAYLGLVAVVGYFVLPYYMITTGAYLNWPAADSSAEVIRLFIGTNVLGIWDELFFICTAFVIFGRHLPFWVANVLQAMLFSSFLFELGFVAWGLPMTFVFALVQAYIFKLTHSLFYIVCIHLLFDFFLFLVLIHAHNRDVLNIFLY